MAPFLPGLTAWAAPTASAATRTTATMNVARIVGLTPRFRRLGPPPNGTRSSAEWSVQARLAAGLQLTEERVGAVGAERVHERRRTDVAVCARERAPVQVAGAAGERERPVDDSHGRLCDERLR